VNARPGPRRARSLIVGGAVVLLVAMLSSVAVIRAVRKDDPGLGSGSAERAAATTGLGEQAGSPSGPLVMLAHRGGTERYPHETLPALLSAARAGADVLTDVYWTSDDVPILIHEGTTRAPAQASLDTPMVCPGGPYPISKTTWAVLHSHCLSLPSASTDGRQYPIATFDEAMKALAAVPGIRVVPEIKADHPSTAQLAQFLTTIEKYGMVRRTIVASWFPGVLERIRTQAETADGITLPLIRFERPDRPPRLLPAAELGQQHLYAVAIRSDGATPDYVAALKAQNLLVITWLVDTPAGWAQARKAGVAAVLTDHPRAYLSRPG
jgi:glycerophosphoryl diester phosphodiesterase